MRNLFGLPSFPALAYKSKSILSLLHCTFYSPAELILHASIHYYIIPVNYFSSISHFCLVYYWQIEFHFVNKKYFVYNTTWDDINEMIRYSHSCTWAKIHYVLNLYHAAQLSQYVADVCRCRIWIVVGKTWWFLLLNQQTELLNFSRTSFEPM